MEINTLQEAASALEARGVPFTQDETTISALTEGRSGTGHNFSTELIIELGQEGIVSSCVGFSGEDLFDIDVEKAIKEYVYRRYMVKSSDGN